MAHSVVTSPQQTILPFGRQEQPLLEISPDVFLLKNFSTSFIPSLMYAISEVTQHAPFRHMMTPMGKNMSVAMSNCGTFGWVSSQKGYRYVRCDPLTRQPWPKMPKIFSFIATRAAQKAGFEEFLPNGCLINFYEGKAHMGLHQDKDEKDFSQPIVSCSLGDSAIFVIGKSNVQPHQISIELQAGDVLVWGGKSRLMKHGIRRLTTLKEKGNKATRYNLTWRYIR